MLNVELQHFPPSTKRHLDQNENTMMFGQDDRVQFMHSSFRPAALRIETNGFTNNLFVYQRLMRAIESELYGTRALCIKRDEKRQRRFPRLPVLSKHSKTHASNRYHDHPYPLLMPGCLLCCVPACQSHLSAIILLYLFSCSMQVNELYD